jgi:hypothetical protein
MSDSTTTDPTNEIITPPPSEGEDIARKKLFDFFGHEIPETQFEFNKTARVKEVLKSNPLELDFELDENGIITDENKRTEITEIYDEFLAQIEDYKLDIIPESKKERDRDNKKKFVAPKYSPHNKEINTLNKAFTEYNKALTDRAINIRKIRQHKESQKVLRELQLDLRVKDKVVRDENLITKHKEALTTLRNNKNTSLSDTQYEYLGKALDNLLKKDHYQSAINTINTINTIYKQNGTPYREAIQTQQRLEEEHKNKLVTCCKKMKNCSGPTYQACDLSKQRDALNSKVNAIYDRDLRPQYLIPQKDNTSFLQKIGRSTKHKEKNIASWRKKRRTVKITLPKRCTKDATSSWVDDQFEVDKSKTSEMLSNLSYDDIQECVKKLNGDGCELEETYELDDKGNIKSFCITGETANITKLYKALKAKAIENKNQITEKPETLPGVKTKQEETTDLNKNDARLDSDRLLRSSGISPSGGA